MVPGREVPAKGGGGFSASLCQHWGGLCDFFSAGSLFANAGWEFPSLRPSTLLPAGVRHDATETLDLARPAGASVRDGA